MTHPNMHFLCRPWTASEVRNLAYYAEHNDSIATIRALLIERRMPAPLPVGWETSDPAKWINTARVAAIYLTFAAWEESAPRLRKSVQTVIRARNRLYKKWASPEFRNRGSKAEIERIDRVISVFVDKTRKSVGGFSLQRWVFDDTLQGKLSDFYLAMPDIKRSEREALQAQSLAKIALDVRSLHNTYSSCYEAYFTGSKDEEQ